ncbi:dihydrolipoyl dehydrogenase family protein [Pseudoroseicyclus aestuarii]|uniref:Pyruvate/2-oxoglutarate dehydrogenase complex dihydrolipoamide dehydrogenase (E3) component n=1 Tax=Pseudoroseicyclus aestuarii TaxID=1795041 RepID=A0A318T0R4_9RHOB|nr:FAD-dependent oxidoreductase [Pseudoroseicyclus aestuarii]PYE83774.1 pyruvate/2-oxoglutarate dehydrogenase complex dihydrolipoamide dehydrogenase (E3) component [Pseudoroseicyclus aestuarii]
MERIETDICVIGAGSGGLTVASGCAQMGARVVLIEKGEMGGDCLNRGCVPSKALIALASQAQTIRSGAPGIAGSAPQVDYAAAMEHVQSVITRIAPDDSQERFEGLGVRVIREAARFTGEDEVEAGPYRIKAKRIVLATGSRPLVPPIEGLEAVPYLTNETLWDLREAPHHLLIVGGGPIGIEMAQAHRRLGCEVTVIDGAKAMAKDDPKLAAVVLQALRDEGVRIVEDAKVTRVEGTQGAITVQTSLGAFEGSHLLVAVGREVVKEGLDLEAGKVAAEGRGIDVDDSLRSTSNPRVYAIGDAAGGLMFTHVAGYHGGAVTRALALGLPSKVKDGHIPHVTYTDPELAQVGLTEEEARKRHGDKLTVIRVPMEQNDRARAEGRTEGMMKLMVVRGRCVGAGIVGPHAGELIGMWSLAVSAGTKLTKISGTVLPYPTLGEIGKKAAGNYFSPKLFGNRWVKAAVRTVQRRRS